MRELPPPNPTNPAESAEASYWGAWLLNVRPLQSAAKCGLTLPCCQSPFSLQLRRTRVHAIEADVGRDEHVAAAVQQLGPAGKAHEAAGLAHRCGHLVHHAAGGAHHQVLHLGRG